MPRLAKLDPVWYRLLVREPFPEVGFPSVAFRLEIHQTIAGSWDWHFQAHQLGTAKYHAISESFRQRAGLEAALYETGFATRHLTVGEVIMERMVRSGWAERVAAPAQLPAHGDGCPWVAP